MVKRVYLFSHDADLACHFRQLFSSRCTVKLITDVIALKTVLPLPQTDIMLIDFQSLKNQNVTILLQGMPRCFCLTKQSSFSGDGNVLSAVHFPEDIPLLLQKPVTAPAIPAENRSALDRLGGESSALAAIKEKIVLAAQTDIPVLITGETGTGKGLVAETIHRLSARGNREWVSVNVAAHTDGLEAAALFGTVRGAFTDAQNRAGFFAQAQDTTLFLDEIGELKRDVQTKLLYAVENGRFRSVGAEKETHTNARIICATNADLKKKMALDEFREDLYYRISRLRISIPPLRERTEDIIPLARAFAAQRGKTLSYAAQQLLVTFRWKGNVRQLAHCIERACLTCGGDIIDAPHIAVD